MKAQIGDLIVRIDRLGGSRAKLGLISKVNWVGGYTIEYGPAIQIREEEYRLATKEEQDAYYKKGIRNVFDIVKVIDNYSVI